MDEQRLEYLEFYNQSCNVSTINSSSSFGPPIAVIRIIGSILSILGSTSIIIAVFLTGKLSNMEIHPLFSLAVGDFILSCLWLFGGSLWLDTYQDRYSDIHPGLGLCYILAISTTIVNMVTSFLTIVYSLHAFIVMRQLSKSRGHISRGRTCKQHLITAFVYLVAWSLPLLLVLPVTESMIGLDIANNACWCFIDFFNTRPGGGPNTEISDSDDLATIIAVYSGVTFVVTAIAIIALYAGTLHMARKVLKHQKTLNSEINSSKVIKKLAGRAAAFIIIYLICGLPFLAGAIDVWKENTPLHLLEKPDQTILFWQAIFGPLQGFLNAIVYGWSRPEFRRLFVTPCKKLRRRMRVKDTHVLIDSVEEYSYYH
ncbi:PREDICTED: transmembrane protein 116-like [Amphimedon queenslandica]|uniref:G-protein coupled receptors family 1 profile domain-containing protein n=1 Tax=Amphimedon queenslandica TaxID=400682 RepID=A0A1X7UMS0_AMPQE|nr:PREDICTED: transmembrane protein 116-like [Amphimedon queenslandica]|eukprot:XP_011404615.1 PREDICTED: transmembrane protein 116-like [Amphimedon queenslandica]